MVSEMIIVFYRWNPRQICEVPVLGNVVLNDSGRGNRISGMERCADRAPDVRDTVLGQGEPLTDDLVRCRGAPAPATSGCHATAGGGSRGSQVASAPSASVPVTVERQTERRGAAADGPQSDIVGVPGVPRRTAIAVVAVSADVITSASPQDGDAGQKQFSVLIYAREKMLGIRPGCPGAPATFRQRTFR